MICALSRSAFCDRLKVARDVFHTGLVFVPIHVDQTLCRAGVQRRNWHKHPYIRDDQGAESISAQSGRGRRVSKGARRTMLKIATG
jgi:hypothetical protein